MTYRGGNDHECRCHEVVRLVLPAQVERSALVVLMVPLLVQMALQLAPLLAWCPTMEFLSLQAKKSVR